MIYYEDIVKLMQSGSKLLYNRKEKKDTLISCDNYECVIDDIIVDSYMIDNLICSGLIEAKLIDNYVNGGNCVVGEFVLTDKGKNSKFSKCKSSYQLICEEEDARIFNILKDAADGKDIK